MASYTYKLKEIADLCHFSLATEKDFGVQCVMLRDLTASQEYTIQHCNVINALMEGREKSLKDVAFLHVASPGKGFDRFDQEKYKLVLTGRAYIRLLEFFHSDWPLLQKRLDMDYQNIRSKKEWISKYPSVNFRGPADIVYTLPLDATNTLSLDLVVTRRCENGKTNIWLGYTDEKLGSVHLPNQTMSILAKDLANMKSLYDYKEGPANKRGRQ